MNKVQSGNERGPSLCHRMGYPVKVFVIFLNRYVISGDFIDYNLKIRTNASHIYLTFRPLSNSPCKHRVEAET